MDPAAGALLRARPGPPIVARPPAGAALTASNSGLSPSAALTLWTYADLLPGADQDAARRIDDLLSGSKRVANNP